MAVVAAHLGVIDEDAINAMSIPFFRDILSALNRKLRYESVSNLFGNSFCKDAQKYIEEAYPLAKAKKISSGFADMLSSASIVKIESNMNNKNTKIEGFSDLSWADGLM